MESLRQQVLQAELKRIEDEAEGRSFAIMNKADALLAGHELCQRINAVEPLIDEFEPQVCYYGGRSCEVLIYTRTDGDVFVRRCLGLGFVLEVMKKSFNDNYEVAIDGFKGVRAIIRKDFLDLASAPELAAA